MSKNIDIPGCSCRETIGDEYYCEVHGGDHWENERRPTLTAMTELERLRAMLDLLDQLEDHLYYISWPESSNDDYLRSLTRFRKGVDSRLRRMERERMAEAKR